MNKHTVLSRLKAKGFQQIEVPNSLFFLFVFISSHLLCVSNLVNILVTWRGTETVKTKERRTLRDNETPSSLPRDCISLELLRHFLEMLRQGGHVPFRFIGVIYPFLAFHFIPQTDWTEIWVHSDELHGLCRFNAVEFSYSLTSEWWLLAKKFQIQAFNDMFKINPLNT